MMVDEITVIEDLTKETASLGISEKTKKDYNIVVGIDFGTTYSGIAYAKVLEDGTNNPEINDISKWPGGTHQQTTTQVPTKSIYKNGEMVKWGEQNKHHRDKSEVNIVRMFKLLLDETPTKIDNISSLPEGVDIKKVISDYLEAIYQHAYKRMSDIFGKKFDGSKVRFCLTVPAVWTDKAKAIMRDAVVQAGIINSNDPKDRLLLVGEPEAAALYCESVIKEYDLKHHDTFLICDAGGGTVDLVVYKISNEKDKERFLIEVAAGDGGLCGSINIDNRFKDLVSSLIFKLTNIPLTEEELAVIVKHFAETQKPNIIDPSDSNAEDDIDIIIALPSKYEHFSITDGSVTIDRMFLIIDIKDIYEKIFDPVVNEVLNLIESQCNGVEKLDALFLVGGFGQSSYLFGKIKEKFLERIRLICQPERGQTAIVRGAVLMGLNPLFVKQRVVRRTYGYQCAMEYDDIKDKGRKKVRYKDGRYYCNGRFQKYAKKGDVNDIDYYIDDIFSICYDINPSIHLFAYDGDIKNIPRYTDHPDVHEIMKFDIIIPRIPGKKIGDLVKIDIRFYLYQTEIKLKVKIGDNEKTYTGSYLKKKNDIIDTPDKGTHSGIQHIEESYDICERPKSPPVEEEEIGIQRTINEEEYINIYK